MDVTALSIQHGIGDSSAIDPGQQSRCEGKLVAFAWQGKRLQLHGFVADLRQRPNSLDYKFDVQYNGKVIPARYTGVVPDTFKNASEVVLKGKLQDGTFVGQRDSLVTKCPSKFQAAPNGSKT